MGPLLASYIIIMGSLVFGAVACSFSFGGKIVARITVIWAIVLTLAFFTSIWALVAVVIFAAVAIKDEPPETKVFYFVALMPVLPLEAYNIPFPGLNYLWELSFIRILVLGLFFPLFVIYVSRDLRDGGFFRLSDLFFLCFIVLTAVMSLRMGNVISALRAMFSTLVDVGIPYFVISRFLFSSKGLNWLLCGFLISAAFLSFFSIFESILKWRLYSEVLVALNLEFSPVALIPYSRSGVVRASGGSMLQPLAFAYFISLAIVVCFFLWKRNVIRFIPAGILMGLYLLALLFTDSKGGMLSMSVGLFIIYFMQFHKSVKLLFGMAGAIIFPVMIGYFITFGFSAIDSQGSYEYRYQLILNSLSAVSQNFLLGSADFLNDPSLERSRQGEGIIDVVNLYLQVVLQYGMVGLFLYVMTFVTIIRDVVKKKSVVGFEHKDLLVALLVMTMVFIGTCSDVSYIPWYITLLWGVSRAYVNFDEKVPEYSGAPLKTVAG